jgi:hypothetical protein
MRTLLIRIAMWASAGFLVSAGWGFYFANTNKGIPIESAIYILARFTQPTAAVFLYLNPNFPIGVRWVVVANAAAYALLGVMVETVRQYYRSLHTSN